jgi:DNA-binding XRE family transcriptional regulator
MKTKNNIITWSEHLDKKYGKEGTAERQEYQEGFEAFKIGVLIAEERKRQNLTQQELAKKIGTSKSYISRIENDASDIRLSTLIKIIKEGLGGKLNLSFK